MLFDSQITSLPQLHAKTIKAYAVTAKSRLASAPDIPTMDEAGLSGMYLAPWFGLWAPRGTPSDVITRLNSAARAALADLTLQAWLAEYGLQTFPSDQQTPDALLDLQMADIDKWWPIIKAAGIKAE
jgi:tripartite-type tricarboxylate transporter receptor subunit TctC